MKNKQAHITQNVVVVIITIITISYTAILIKKTGFRPYKSANLGTIKAVTAQPTKISVVMKPN